MQITEKESKNIGNIRIYTKKRSLQLIVASFSEERQLPTLPQYAVPSAQLGLTSLFGMGRGGTPTL